MSYTYSDALQNACIQLTCGYSEFILLCDPEEHKNFVHSEVYQAFSTGNADHIIARVMRIELTAQIETFQKLAGSFLYAIESFLKLQNTINEYNAGNLPVD